MPNNTYLSNLTVTYGKREVNLYRELFDLFACFSECSNMML